MQMKHYKDNAGGIHGIAKDGSQDFLIKKDWVAIDDSHVPVLVNENQIKEFNKNDYYRKRIYSYPELGEFVDAWVKGDEAALEEYRQKCLEIKAKYPKPEGF